MTEPRSHSAFRLIWHPLWLTYGRGMRYECPQFKATTGEPMAVHALLMAWYGSQGRIITHLRNVRPVDALGRRLVIDKDTNIRRGKGGRKTGTIARRRLKHRMPAF